MLVLSRGSILGHRRRVGALDERLPPGPDSLRVAAWAGLQDSMPRAALLSIHARAVGTGPSTLDDPALVQLWGPRFSAYVVPAVDRAVFTLGRLTDVSASRREAEDLASRLHDFLDGRRLTYGEAGAGLGVHPNRLRYAATTGTVLMRWDGARAATIWTVPRPEMSVADAAAELARRFLHVLGPGTPATFARWAGIGLADARRMFEALAGELVGVRTPVGDGSILAADEASFRYSPDRPAPARLLPSGDPYFLLHGVDRGLLVTDAARRAALWTPRVWPGAILVGGEIVGTWRRAETKLDLAAWRPFTAEERAAVEEEALSLPLPGLSAPISISWIG